MKSNQRNKLLIVLPTAIIGGAERVAFNLANHFSNDSLNFKVTVYFMSRGNQNNIWGFLSSKKNIELIYANSVRERTSLFSLFKYLFGKKFHLVYSTHTHVNAFLSFSRRLNIFNSNYLIGRESTVITDRFTGLRKLEFDFLYKLYYSHDLLICQTNYMKEQLIINRGCKIAKKIAVIPNPIDLTEITKSLQQNDINHDGNKYNILFVGRIIEIKNLSLLLKAIFLLPPSIQENIAIHVIGDGQQKNEMQFLAQNLNIKNITFHGSIQNPYPYMKAANVGIISSIREGFPNVILEMMASGTKYIISTPCAGDLDLLPNIKILNDLTPATLSEAIEEGYEFKFDNTISYADLIHERTINNYIGKIYQILEI